LDYDKDDDSESIFDQIAAELKRKNFLVVFWVNEAQNLPSDTYFTQMRYFVEPSSFEDRISMILIGPSVLVERKLSKECQSLHRRLNSGVRISLDTLNEDEIFELVRLRLTWARHQQAATIDPFTEVSLSTLYSCSGGIPSIAVQLIDLCLKELMDREDDSDIDKEFVIKTYNKYLRSHVTSGVPFEDLPEIKSLEDVIRDIIIAVYKLGEATTKEIVHSLHPKGIKEKAYQKEYDRVRKALERLFKKEKITFKEVIPGTKKRPVRTWFIAPDLRQKMNQSAS
jgi:hypothetical protein